MKIVSSSLLVLMFFLSSCIVVTEDEKLDETIFIRHEGADMPAYVHGNLENKTFLIVIHGAGSFGLSFRDERFINNIEEEYVVVYFDNRAQSMSQGHLNSTDDIINLMASDVEALTDVLKHKYGDDITLFLMGHSLGGLVTGKSLLRNNFQEEFNGWINVDGVFDMPSILAWRVELLYDVAEEQIDLGNSVNDWETIENTLDDLDFDDETAYAKVFELIVKAYALVIKDEQVNNPTSIERFYQTIFQNNPLTWQFSHLFHKPELTAREEEYSILDQMDVINIPTIFAYGKYDFSVPAGAGQSAFERISAEDKQFVEFARTTHHPFVTEPNAFTLMVKNFMDRLR